jgi:DNA-binding NarL/FixJ family response regulator
MSPTHLTESKIRVAILDDHQSALDSYELRLSGNPNIVVVGAANYGNELGTLLESGPIDVLVLDVGVPNSAEDRNPYPILHLLPHLQKTYPRMAILVISMHDQHALVKAILDAGASGYILKEDRDAIIQLAEVVTLVNTGGVYLSQKLRSLVSNGEVQTGIPLLSPREQEVLSLAAAYPNITTLALAERMHIAPSTVRNLLSKAYKRLHVRNRSAATEKARRLGLIAPHLPDPSITN